MPIMSKSANYWFQSTLIIPTIDKAWESLLRQIHSTALNKDVIMLGDGRMDGPGFCAKYCTYVTIDYKTNNILGLEIIDKRKISLKSPTMEMEGFIRTLNVLEAKCIKITEVVTDAHKSIAEYMGDKHPQKKHTHDVWHPANGLSKKLGKLAEKKENEDMKPWTKHIVTHFWHCVKTSNTYSEFVALWKGVLHHIAGEHSWKLGEGGKNYCEHGDLEDTDVKPLLKRGTAPYTAVKNVIWKTTFLRTIPRILNFRSTSIIENFNSLVLKYASKRIAFRYGAYKAWNQLAALDYQLHKDRLPRKNKKGELVYKRKFNKCSSRWTTYPEKCEKTLLH